MLRIPRFTFLLLAMALLTSSAFAQAAGKGKGNDDKATPPGQTAAVDKEGKLRQPTPEELRDLLRQIEALVSQESGDLKTVILEDGSEAVDLEGRFMSVKVARMAETGELEYRCVHSSQEAEAFLKGELKAEQHDHTPTRKAPQAPEVK